MEPTSHAFVENAREALNDAVLNKALGNMKAGFQDKRAAVIARLPEFEDLRDQGRDIKNHVLAHLDHYLERFEESVTKSGGTVHWAPTAADAREAVLGICRAAGARNVTKGKSMVAEEIGLNDHLEANGIDPIETDLGEYIIQLRGELPSHIIAPAIHLVKEQVAESFYEHHQHLDPDRSLNEPRELCDEARSVLRQKFLGADVGITGANFLIAETGSTVIVTNEGNGDLTQNLPRIHIVVCSIEKVVPTLEDAQTILRLLARSATGQEYSAYTTFSTGPKRAGDLDGPDEFHVVLLDNGRSAMLGTPAQEALRCIRCGACMNHCPVYASVGGHAYGWVVPGPIGAALDPGLIGLEEAGHLPNASTFCGRCESVCPMRIPLPSIMRYWREQEHERRLSPATMRFGIGVWAWFAQRPAVYRLGAALDPGLIGLEEAGHLPNASTFCGRCESVCPMRIPLPSIMRYWREQEHERRLSPATMRFGIGVWAWFAQRPALYRLGARLAASLLGRFGRKSGRLRHVPLAGGWTGGRDLPAPQGRTFQQLWAEHQKSGAGR